MIHLHLHQLSSCLHSTTDQKAKALSLLLQPIYKRKEEKEGCDLLKQSGVRKEGAKGRGGGASPIIVVDASLRRRKGAREGAVDVYL